MEIASHTAGAIAAGQGTVGLHCEWTGETVHALAGTTAQCCPVSSSPPPLYPATVVPRCSGAGSSAVLPAGRGGGWKHDDTHSLWN